jgi:hypothetical protein
LKLFDRMLKIYHRGRGTDQRSSKSQHLQLNSLSMCMIYKLQRNEHQTKSANEKPRKTKLLRKSFPLITTNFIVYITTNSLTISMFPLIMLLSLIAFVSLLLLFVAFVVLNFSNLLITIVSGLHSFCTK